jgi:hypothetical protein
MYVCKLIEHVPLLRVILQAVVTCYFHLQVTQVPASHPMASVTEFSLEFENNTPINVITRDTITSIHINIILLQLTRMNE